MQKLTDDGCTSELKIADIGWHELLIEELERAIKLSKEVMSDLQHLRQCDGSGCGRMFDGRDPRSATVKENNVEYHFCPGCNLEAGRDADRKAKS